jgi:hypothetical protein
MRLAVLSILLLSAALGALADGVPSLERTEQCFEKEGALPTYLEAIRAAIPDFSHIDMALRDACYELDPINVDGNYESSRGFWSRLYSVAPRLLTPLQAEIPTLFAADIFEGNSELQSYKSQLAKIGQTQDRYIRIRDVYNLVVSRQGDYMESLLKPYLTLSTPGAILQSAKETGEGGICRHFAALLQWSLSMVQKSPTLSAEHQRWGSLDENSFSVKKVYSPDHVWVEVLLPVKDPRGGMNYKRFQLDTTRYNEFVPLFPRMDVLGPGVREAHHKQCEKIRRCIR